MRSLGYWQDYSETSPSIAQLFSLEGRVALITGAASGIGRAVAMGFARFGADVALVDLQRGQAEEVAGEIREMGRRAAVYVADVTEYAQIEAAVQQAHQALGRIDILLNSAGVNVRKPILEMAPDEFERVIDVNLTGSWNAAKACAPVMAEQGRGKIISLASIYGHVAIEGNGAYAASKGGIVQLTKVLAVELAPKNIQVNCLAPMYIKTNLTVPIQNETFIETVIKRGPTPRFGEAWELIGPAVLLASDAGGLITGHSLIIDGGWTAI